MYYMYVFLDNSMRFVLELETILTKALFKASDF